MQDCHRRIDSQLSAHSLNQEWLAVFGDESRSALSLLATSHLSDELNVLKLAIPRVLCLRPNDLASLLSSYKSYSEINSISCHRYSIYPDANLDLSPTAHSVRYSAQVTSRATEANKAFFADTGITWSEIIKLFIQHQWGIQILYYYAEKIKNLDKGERIKATEELSLFTEQGAVEKYFAALES
jgi:hypothetical protein